MRVGSLAAGSALAVVIPIDSFSHSVRIGQSVGSLNDLVYGKARMGLGQPSGRPLNRPPWPGPQRMVALRRIGTLPLPVRNSIAPFDDGYFITGCWAIPRGPSRASPVISLLSSRTNSLAVPRRLVGASRSRARRPKIKSAAAGWICLWIAACSDDSASNPAKLDFELDLLSRQPDRIVEEVGLLEPMPGAPFGPRAIGRWRFGGQVQVETPGSDPASKLELPFAECAHPTGGVLLSKVQREASSLHLWLAPPDVEVSAPFEVLIELNDIKLGEVTLESEPAEFEFEIPDRLWQVGDNRLELTAPGTQRTAEGFPCAFQLGPVTWGSPARVTADPSRRELGLGAYTSVEYGFEPRGAGRLDLSVKAPAEGVFLWKLVGFNPLSSEETRRLQAGDQGLEAGENVNFSWEFGTESQPLRLELDWHSENPGELLVERALVSTKASQRPNVILIGIDTLSASHTSLYGYPRDTTPRLREFAREAIQFDPMVTNATWTLPSFLAMMSGLPSGAHRLDLIDDRVERVDGWETLQLAPNRWTLAEAFRAGGWRTGAFVDTNWLAPEFGFEQGFEVLDGSSDKVPLADRTGGLTRVASLAEEWLGSLDEGDPSFLFLHAYDVHGPYGAPPDWRAKFADEPPLELPETVPVDGPLQAYDVVPTYIARGEQPTGELPPTMDPRPIVNAYDAGIAEVDDKLGDLFDRWRADGRLDRSIIMLTSDHGESMTDQHRLFGHGFIGSAITRVPLLVRLPHGKHGGLKVRGMSQTIDLMPTLLELCGFSLEGRGFPGRSFASILNSPEDSTEERVLPVHNPVTEHGSMPNYAFEQGRWRLVRLNPHEGPISKRLTSPWMDPDWRSRYFPESEAGMTIREGAEIALRHATIEELSDLVNGGLSPELVFLYDLEADPRELIDRAAEHPERVAEFTRRLDEALADTEWLRSLGRPASAVRGVTEEDLEHLRAIGYAE